MDSCFPLLKRFSSRSYQNGTSSTNHENDDKETVNTKDVKNGACSIPSIRYEFFKLKSFKNKLLNLHYYFQYFIIINIFYHSATFIPNKIKDETENGVDMDGSLHEPTYKSEWNGEKCLLCYFPKMFVTVIYIVVLFVSLGTIFVQLMIFSKGMFLR